MIVLSIKFKSDIYYFLKYNNQAKKKLNNNNKGYSNQFQKNLLYSKKSSVLDQANAQRPIYLGPT